MTPWAKANNIEWLERFPHACEIENKVITELTVADENDWLITEGNLSPSIQWRYDDDTNTVIISGFGKTPDYYRPEPETPWKYFKYKIKKVIFEEGITSIGWQLFYNYPNIEEVVFADSITSVGLSAFEGCHKLKSLKTNRTIILPYMCFDEAVDSSECLMLESNAFFMTVWAKNNNIEWLRES